MSLLAVWGCGGAMTRATADPSADAGGDDTSGSPPGSTAPAVDAAVATTSPPADAARPPADRPAGPDVRAIGDAPGAPAPPAVGGAPSPCRFKLCESFEEVAEGALPGAPWRRSASAGVTLAVGSARAARGTKALHVVLPPGPGRGYVSETATFPELADGYYGRMFLYIERSNQTTAFVHWGAALATSKDPGAPSLEYGGTSRGPGTSHFLFNDHGAVGAETQVGVSDNVVIPERTWHCLEWYIDRAANEARFWWNGQERTRMHYQHNSADPRFTFPHLSTAYFGFESHQNLPAGDNGYEVWVDELALDSQRIGCD